MKTSIEWLNQFLGTPLADSQRVADALMRGGLPVESIEQVGPDTVLDVEVTSNRSDCLSHIGVAREVAALLNVPFKDLQIPQVRQSSEDVKQATSVRIDPGAAHLCPQYTARIIRGVNIRPSPQWMIRRLEAIGVRSINNVVDVTNYVMFELGQPLHAFDYARLAGRQIIVRTAKPGEKITSIDGHERALAPDMLVIADAEKPVALAGVMGGRDSEVSPQTTDILLESARFDPLSVRRTARALAMKSDSSYRFERGLDPTLAERASLRAAQLILETAGGELCRGMATAGESIPSPKSLTLRLDQLPRILGIQIPLPEVIDALTRLQLSPKPNTSRITVTIPSWRLDLNIERDLVEEVARVVGYERIPVRDEIAIRLTPPEPQAKALDVIRSTLVAAGFFESVTFTFVSDALAGDFVPAESRALPRADAAVRKADARLRPSLLPGLLEAVRRNEANGTPGARLFEIGATFGVDAAGNVQETRRVALAGGTDLRETRGAVEAMLNRLDAERQVRVVPDDRTGFARGACGRVQWGDQTIGYIGRIDRAIAEAKLSLRELPTAAELELAPLLSGAQHVPQLRPLPRFPAVQRDLSLVVAESAPYAQLDELIRKLDLPDIESVNYVTTYRGKPLEKGTKSITLTLVFRSSTTTLTGDQVEAAVQRVVESAQRELGAALRT